MKRSLFAASLIGLLIGFAAITDSPPAQAAQFITNGNFGSANCNATGGGFTLGLVGAAVPGWFIPSTDGTYPWCITNSNIFGAGPAAPGATQWFVIGNVGADGGGGPKSFSIQQTMTGLVPSDLYNLTFSIASEEFCCSVVQTSFLSGSSTPAQDFTAPQSGAFWTSWATQSENFVATSSTVTLQFSQVLPSNPDNGADIGLTNVSVTGPSLTTTPEPSSLLLLSPGLLGLGMVWRRRKSAA